MTLRTVLRLMWDCMMDDTRGQAAVSVRIPQTIEKKFPGADVLISLAGELGESPDVYDLDSGEVLDPLGNAVELAKVLAVFVQNNTAEGDITLGGANDVPLSTGAITIPPGAIHLSINEAGFAVTADTGDKLTVSGAAGSTYDLILIGQAPVPEE